MKVTTATTDSEEVRKILLLVKDRESKEPFDEAGTFVYQSAFRKGLAWIPAGHILRMNPPIVMDLDAAAKCMDIIDEAIGEAEKHFGFGSLARRAPAETSAPSVLPVRQGPFRKLALMGVNPPHPFCFSCH